MRGTVDPQIQLSLVTPEQLVPAEHPIRGIKPIVDAALGELDPIFAAMYSEVGRPSIPPEHLLKACLLMAFYSIRSERQFCERMQYDLLFKWFLDLNIDDLAWDQSTFAKNRERLLENQVSGHFFAAIREEAKRRHLLSRDHFTVDGTLLEAKASLKSLAPRPNLGGQHKKRKRNRGRGGRRGPGQAAVVALTVTRKSTGEVRGVPTRPTSRPPMPKPDWQPRVLARQPSSASPGTSSWRTGMAWWSMST